MSHDNHIDVKIMGREYRVACTPENENNLRDVVSFVDGKMTDIAAKTRNTIPERIAVMAALNIAHELLARPSEAVVATPASSAPQVAELNAARDRIQVLNARLDAALEP